MNETLTLYVGWQNQDSRRWFVVGRIRRMEADQGRVEYEFAYVRGVDEAQEHGFQPFVAFPDLDTVVTSHALLPFFRDRLMPKSRPDYQRYLDQLALDPNDDEFAILARSGGVRTTEHAEIELFAPPTRKGDGIYETYFWVRGIRYVDPDRNALVTIQRNDRLFCTLDVQNEKNPNAVLLRTEDRKNVGYAPDYLCDDLSRRLKNQDMVSVTAVKIDPSPLVPARNRVLCHLTARFPAGVRPFSTDNFEPKVSKDLTRAA